MNIFPFCTCLLKYQAAQTIAAWYYQIKTKKHCFVMEQNGRWTLVTLEGYRD